MKSQFLMRAAGACRNAGALALDLVMPPHCPLTQEEIRMDGALGPQAWAAAHFIEAPYCGRCGAPYGAHYGDDLECISCIASPPDFDSARAALVYDDATHGLIVGFKHGDRTELAPMFAGWMARAGSDLLSDATIIVPAPLHRRRLFSRRYNQSALLAREIARLSRTALSIGEFVRVRSTPPQKDLSASARRRNVAGAFGFRDDRARETFSGAHVVLVDDVMTTGATLCAAARALKRAGAGRVDALVLARVVKGGSGAI